MVDLRWVTRITRWVPDSEFEDVQEEGPYRVWIHTHRFDGDGDRVTMHDRVEYALPMGAVGRLVHRLAVRRQLEAIFDFRRQAIEEIFPER
jgi:ligand-binding SRPBCC domain-containing protein